MRRYERWIGHWKTITRHKVLVMRYCFRIGLYRQGLLHDMSKYMPSEFLAGVKYYQGGRRSPNNAEREALGCSRAWLHHKGRNKHHLEYWIDYSPNPPYLLCGMEIPLCYVAEMFCDRVAASKNYERDQYTDASAYQYYEKSKGHYLLHENTEKLLESLLIMLKDKGEEETFRHLRELLRSSRHNNKGNEKRCTRNNCL